MRWELLQGLVWLASRMKTLCDEHTIRRYLEDRSRRLKAKVPPADLDLLKQVIRLADDRESESFLQAAEQYLTTAAVPGTSKTTAAR